MNKISKKLIDEIQNISNTLQEHQQFINEIKQYDYKYRENDYDNPKKKLKKQETYYEHLQENYLRYSLLTQITIEETQKLFIQFQKYV